jgi:hypothetical protein
MWRGGLVAFLLVAGCGATEPATCVLGQSTACTCTNGRPGAQVCTAAAAYGPCMCVSPDGSAPPDTAPDRSPERDAGPDAADPDVAPVPDAADPADVPLEAGGLDTAEPLACPGVADDSGKLCAGTFTVTNSVDFEAVRDCQTITGDLVVQGAGLGDLRFEQLQSVRGSLSLTSTGAQLFFPALVRVGTNVSSTGLGRLEAPRLSFVGGEQALGADHLSFACLSAASAGLSLAGQTVSLPRLTTVALGLRLGTYPAIELPALRSTGPINAGNLGTAALPALESATSLLAEHVTRLDLPLVGHLDKLEANDVGELNVGATSARHVDLKTVRAGALPRLQEIVLGLFVRSVDRLEVPRLGQLQLLEASTSGELVIGATSGQLLQMTGIRVASFPRMQELAEGHIDAIERLDFPALRSLNTLIMTGPRSGTGSLAINLPALERASVLALGLDTEVPQCDELGRITRMQVSRFSADRLATVNVLAVSFTKGLTDLTFPALRGAPVPFRPAIRINQNDNLAGLSLPAMVDTRELNIGIEGCGNPALTTIDFRALTRANGRIQFNAQLPQCRVDALIQQLQEGTITTSGNNATCPP